MNTSFRSLIALSTGILCSASLALAAENNGSPTSGKLPASDQAFIKKAAAGGMAEVEMGKLAESKAGNADVKAFGQRMVADHTKANEDLKVVAAQKGVTLPAEPDAKSKEMMKKMEALSPEAFDKMYVSDMLADHKKDVGEFEKESKSTKDTELKGFVDKTLPVLKEHLDMVQKLSQNAPAGKK